MAELGQQTVEFSTLVSRAAEDSFLSLKELVEKSKSSEMSDSEKKISILKYLVKTQQRMLRLNVLAKWCQQVPLIQYCQQLTSTLSSHDSCFTQAADSMFFMHEGLQQARAPIYDVPSSIEVLLTGSYQRLPKCIEDLGMQSALTKDKQKPALQKLDVLVRSKLLEVSLPKEITEVKVSDGTASVRVEGEFKVLTTLGYRGHMSMWRILHMDLLVGDQSGPVKLELTRRHILGDDLERRMAASENPFGTLYSVLHDFCVSLVMDTVIKQVRSLLQGRWKDAIKFELISYGSGGSSSMQVSQDGEVDSTGVRTPGLKIIYWLDFEKNSNLSDGGACPYIKIEPGFDSQIKCVHSSFVIDPLTNKEAEFLIDQSCIDVEKLLLRAISCNRYTRLFEIYKDLGKNVQICRSSGDVLLHCLGGEHDSENKQNENKSNAEGKEVLRVRAYGSAYFTLGINIRNGRFLLQSSKNVISSSALSECEEALNDGHMTSAEVFMSLRSKSILHLFACIGKFLGLQVYENGFSAVKVPKSALTGTNMMLMGFPECGNSYFLLMQLDRDFKPIFKLLETQPNNPSSRSQSSSESSNVLRVKNIDVSKMQMLEDELNLSLIDSTKLQSLSSSNNENNDQTSKVFQLEGSVVSSSLSSSFSSIVDEVFELECGPSASQYPVQTFNSSFSGTHVTGRSGKKLSASKSEQDLASLRSPYSSDAGSRVSMDDQLTSMRKKSTGASKGLAGALTGSSRVPGSGSWVTAAPSSQVEDSSIHSIIPKQDSTSRKRTISDMLNQIPSLQSIEAGPRSSKRRKTDEAVIIPSTAITEIYSYSHLIAEANKGNLPSNIYVSALLHVVRHCSLCIKHARLTSQMDSLDIPYVEEVGLRNSSSNLWFRLPLSRVDTWQYICLQLGRPGSMKWDVKINDQHFRGLWDLQKGGNGSWGSGVRIANTSDIDSHISYDSDGVVLSYNSVESDSIKRLVSDIQRLYNARTFALGMRKLLGVVRSDEKIEENNDNNNKVSEQMKRSFRIEAVGLMSLWFSFGSGILARFVVEWESGKEGCTMHVSPDQLWPHTKFLEDFINGAEVASLLDCIRLTAGPLHALAAATRPARAAPVSLSTPLSKTTPQPTPAASAAMLAAAAAARGGPGIVPSSLLPIDVSVVLRGPYWIRIIYRKHFAVDMRCFAGDQVWLQPATPPKGGPAAGGSLPCPQFRPFIMEHVAQELNGLDPNFATGPPPPAPPGPTRVGNLGRAGNGSPNMAVALRRSPAGGGVPAHVRGELNTAIIGLGDDGGYGGGWVPLVALKKVLRGILKYLGVLWLFAQLPDLLKEILGSILKDNEGSLLNLDQEQPALRFFVGGYVFAVSVHRVQLLLQVLSVRRFHHSQNQQQQNAATTQEEISQLEITEICDYFSRRVASEPYDASRVASFITLLTLPISVLREFLKLIAWKKNLATPSSSSAAAAAAAAAAAGDITPAQKSRIELCLENHSGQTDNSPATKSNIHYDRSHNAVDFGLTVVLDPAHIPMINAAGGAAWLPYCVSVRLRYMFGENGNVAFLGMEGSHGGRACWTRVEDWDKCKQRVVRTVEMNAAAAAGGGIGGGDNNQGRLRIVADSVQRTLHGCLQELRDGGGGSGALVIAGAT